MPPSVYILVLSLLPAAVAQSAGANKPAAAKPPTAPSATQPASDPQPASDLDYWLSHAKPVEPNQPGATARPAAGSAPGAAATGEAPNPFRKSDLSFRRGDAMPGVIELSDGNQLPGGLYTTVEKPWIVWSEATKSWRRVDFLTLLSIEAVVEEERMELDWRWKGMGEPEKVYSGKKYPMRRMHWRFKLIDGSVVEGSTKGQPVFVELAGKVSGPFILGERMKGQLGQTLEDLVYVRKIVVSRKMMDLVIADKAGQAGERKD